MFAKLKYIPVALVILSSFATKINAFSITGDTQVASGDTVELEIIANPGGTFDTAQISLNVSANAQVIDYTAPTTNWESPISSCPNDDLFTANQICTDLIKSQGNITTGESLGTITLRINSGGAVTVSGSVDNGYVQGSSFKNVAGTLFQINTTQTGSTTSNNSTLPTTGVDGLNLNYFLLGILWISLGVILLKLKPFVPYLNSRKFSFKVLKQYEKK